MFHLSSAFYSVSCVRVSLEFLFVGLMSAMLVLICVVEEVEVGEEWGTGREKLPHNTKTHTHRTKLPHISCINTETLTH